MRVSARNVDELLEAVLPSDALAALRLGADRRAIQRSVSVDEVEVLLEVAGERYLVARLEAHAARAVLWGFKAKLDIEIELEIAGT